jgi:hypothetical protein
MKKSEISDKKEKEFGCLIVLRVLGEILPLKKKVPYFLFFSSPINNISTSNYTRMTFTLLFGHKGYQSFP